jgi:DNA-binding NarL/FixJ family response regulator
MMTAAGVEAPDAAALLGEEMADCRAELAPLPWLIARAEEALAEAEASVVGPQVAYDRAARRLVDAARAQEALTDGATIVRARTAARDRADEEARKATAAATAALVAARGPLEAALRRRTEATAALGRLRAREATLTTRLASLDAARARLGGGAAPEPAREPAEPGDRDDTAGAAPLALPERRARVAELLGAGRSYRQVAAELGLSLAAVQRDARATATG